MLTNGSFIKTVKKTAISVKYCLFINYKPITVHIIQLYKCHHTSHDIFTDYMIYISIIGWVPKG
jgi:hypothetical protein